MELNPYLTFDGDCEAAFKFYAQCLGGEITMMIPVGGSPMAAHAPPDRQDKILHARLAIGDKVLMGSDVQPDSYEKAQGFSVSLGIEDPTEAERVFHALAQDGTVRMPIQETFWAIRFGILVDRFGIPWMINCEAPTTP